MLLVLASFPRPADAASLEEGFTNPPLAARSRAYWWWLNGNVTPQSITHDLEEMKAKGMGGGLIFDAGGATQEGNNAVPEGPTFASPRWRELFKHTLHEADRLGLEIDLNITSGWNLGGPMITPAQALKKTTTSEITIGGPQIYTDTLPQPPANEGFYRDIAVIAYPAPTGRAKPPEPLKWFAEKALLKELGNEFGGFSAPDASPLLRDEPIVPGEEDLRAEDEIDLTSKMDEHGKLVWDVPAGDWVVVRIGYTITGARVSTGSGKWNGLSIDHLSTAPFQSYWNQVVDPLVADAGSLAGKALTRLQTDSWEMGVANWTDDFAAEFQRRRGYDLRPYLPILAGKILQDRGVSNRFLYDFRRTVADCIADNHYRVFSDTARKHNLGIQCESGGPHGAPIDALQCLGRDDMPMGEFWAPAKTHRVTPQQRFFMKQSASAAHIYGKNRVCGEGFTSIGPHWQETPWLLKSAFDQEACEGLNLIYWHAFVCSPTETGIPGQQYFAGSHLNPKVTWWDDAGAFFSYLNRCQYLLQQGLFVADAVYYYGDSVPDFVQIKGSDPAGVMPGYDYDVTSAEALITRMGVVDHRIVLPDGMSYGILVLPDRAAISLPVLEKIADLVKAGATVVGPRPIHTTGLTGYPASEGKLQQIVAAVWGDCDGKMITEHVYGAGRVIWGKTARQVLAADNVRPDFSFMASSLNAPIDYIHRRTADEEIYFIANLGDKPQDLDCAFRVQGKAPELWAPASGEITPELIYDERDGRTSLPLHLDARGSVFVIFRNAKSPAAHFLSLTRNGSPAPSTMAELILTGDHGVQLCAAFPGDYEIKPPSSAPIQLTIGSIPPAVPISGPWEVQFKGLCAPEPATFQTLKSWTESSDPATRYFSGSGTYAAQFMLSPDQLNSHHRWVLDLGEVKELARVTVNGKQLGTLWKPPFQVDVTAALTANQNTVSITVTNLWPNRLIGDAALPAGQRSTQTNINKFTPASPLIPSGLLGPVQLMPRELQAVHAADVKEPR